MTGMTIVLPTFRTQRGARYSFAQGLTLDLNCIIHGRPHPLAAPTHA